ncbi:hypothetical protein QUF72_21700 [Desulfobacterales bacterium HSG2]|nr:hypothetical protein [Desulfobacterales bacterium HSG2]
MPKVIDSSENPPDLPIRQEHNRDAEGNRQFRNPSQRERNRDAEGNRQFRNPSQSGGMVIDSSETRPNPAGA